MTYTIISTIYQTGVRSESGDNEAENACSSKAPLRAPLFRSSRNPRITASDAFRDIRTSRLLI